LVPASGDEILNPGVYFWVIGCVLEYIPNRIFRHIPKALNKETVTIICIIIAQLLKLVC
jgi:hypothetical protein